MKVIQNLYIDLARNGSVPISYAVQGDSEARSIAIELMCCGSPWPIPDGVEILICYRKPDGTGGSYDTLPDGQKAWKASGNVVEVTLAPQVCAAAGKVYMDLTLIQGSSQLTTFRFLVIVDDKLMFGEYGGDYINLSAWLSEHGAAGSSVKGAKIDDSGHLLIELSTGEVLDAGFAVGQNGKDGLDGLNGSDGLNGLDGGWYLPGVTQVNSGSVRITFTASNADMPAVDSATIDLPVGRDGKTPVRGTDYWTAADRQAIIADTIAALPDASEVGY